MSSNFSDFKSRTDAKECLKTLVEKQSKLKNELISLETQIYNFEDSYLRETFSTGNIITGHIRYNAESKQNDKIRPHRGAIDKDRLFSSSSITSPVANTNEMPTKKSDIVVKSRKSKKIKM